MTSLLLSLLLARRFHRPPAPEASGGVVTGSARRTRVPGGEGSKLGLRRRSLMGSSMGPRELTPPSLLPEEV